MESRCNRKSAMKQVWVQKPNVEARKLVNVALEKASNQEACSNSKEPVFSSECGDMNVTPIATSLAENDDNKVKNVTNGGRKKKIEELVVQKDGDEGTSKSNNLSEKKRSDNVKYTTQVSNIFAALEEGNNYKVTEGDSGQTDRSMELG